MLRILYIPKRGTKGHELSRWSEQLCNRRVLAFPRHQDVFAFGNFTALIPIDWFVKIKAETILDVTTRLENRHRSKLWWDMLLFNLLDERGNLPA